MSQNRINVLIPMSGLYWYLKYNPHIESCYFYLTDSNGEINELINLRIVTNVL